MTRKEIRKGIYDRKSDSKKKTETDAERMYITHGYLKKEAGFDYGRP